MSERERARQTTKMKKKHIHSNTWTDWCIVGCIGDAIYFFPLSFPYTAQHSTAQQTHTHSLECQNTRRNPCDFCIHSSRMHTHTHTDTEYRRVQHLHTPVPSVVETKQHTSHAYNDVAQSTPLASFGTKSLSQ